MLYTFVVLFSLVATLYIVFRQSWVQTVMARMASVYLSKELKTEVRIRGVDFSLVRGLAIEDVSVKDRNNEYIFRAHKLGVVPRRFNYRKRILGVRKVYIDKGEFQLLTHKGDSVLNLKFLIDYFSSKDTTHKIDTTRGKPWHIFVSSVQLADTRFHLENENTPRQPRGMDYANIDVSHINLLITDFFPEGDTMHGTIKRLSAEERSGFAVHSMSGKFQVGPCFLKADNLKVKTAHCDLDLDFAFLYNSWNAYSDFLDKVNIRAEIRPSVLDLQDIGAFAPVMYGMKNAFHIRGEIKGKVDNFRAKNFYIAFGENTVFNGNISANGLPDVEETFVDLDIHNLNTSKKDIENLNLPEGAGRISLPSSLEHTGIIDLKGNFTGFYNDFVANAHLKTSIGAVNTDLKLTRKKGDPTLEYDGQLDATGIDLGVLSGSPKYLGKVTMRADIKGKGFRFDNAALSMNVHIDSIVLNRYLYRQITVQGSLIDKKFEGKLDVNDPQLVMNFNGLMDFRDSVPDFKFKSDISKANLFALHLLERDSVMDLATRVDVDFTGNDIDNIEGSIKIRDFNYREGKHTIKMDSLTLNTFPGENKRKSYHLRSDFVDADFTGEFSFRDMIPSLSVFANNYLYSFRLTDSLMHHKSASNQVLNYHILLKNTDQVTEVFLPFLRVEEGTLLDGQYNEEKGVLDLNGSSPDIAIKNIHFSNWFIHATSRTDNLHVETGSAELIFKKKSPKDTVEIKIDRFKIASDLRQDSILYQITWLGADPGSKSKINGFVDFTNSPRVDMKMDQFDVYLDHKYWNINPGNLIVFDTNRISIQNMGFFSKEQRLDINGAISRSLSDTLDFNFSKVDISHLDKLLSTTTVDIDGFLSGNLKIFDLYGKLRILSDLRIDQLRFNSEPLGSANLSVLYDNDKQRFDVRSKIIYTGNIGTNIPLDLEGNVSLKETDPRINLDLNLKNLNLKMLNPFVSGFMSQISGFASGDLKIKGSFSKPVMHGEVKLMRTEFKINYLNVPYSFSDVVTFDTNRIVFNNISLFDSLGNKAILNGKITHNYFQDLRLDLGINYEDFSAFKNTYAQNNIFYGTARATGTVMITGPVDNIAINVKAKTGNGTHVIIPINMTAEVGQNDYIIFTNPGEDTLKVPGTFFKKPATGLTLNLALLVNPSANVEVFLPDQLGNIKATGIGNMTMEMTPTTNFALLGTYTLQKGSFLLALKNLLRLNFIIREGGRITWTGDPTDAYIALNAVYKTRVPLSGLTSDQDKANIRIPVDCIIRLNGRLMNPDISFGMELPNVDEEIKSIVYGAIDTSNTSEMNQQMMYVLVMNQFRPITSSGMGKFDVGTTSLSLLTNQVSSLFSKISKNLNVGINYKPGTQSTTNEFDVSVSTQLLNDRLLIDGLFGMSSNYTSSVQKANTLVGDINMEYILTNNRRWRLRAFNRTNVIDVSLNNNAPYTQGIGISFQRDFNTLRDLFQKEKKKKEGGGKK